MLNRGVLTTYIAIVAVTITALALIKTFNISYPLTVTNLSSSNHLSVVGEGKVEALPDLAVIDAGIVVANSPTVEAVQSEIRNKNTAIVDDLKKNFGVNDKDIKTSNFNVYPNQDYNPGSGGKITGYNGNATLSIRVRDTQKVNDIVAALTKSGANQINSINYSIEDPDKYREQARDEAIQNAKQQAEKLASSLGIRLGKVVNVIESGNQNDYPGSVMAREASGYGGGGGNSVQPGSQTVTSVVTLFFEKR